MAQAQCTDPDNDGVCSSLDNCPDVFNPSQANSDGDAYGDACDPCIDVDGDGSCKGTDCNDNDPNNYPGNTETCDSQDNNCNNEVDE